MTPNEANRKICPYGMNAAADPMLCQAESCMAWTWADLSHRYYLVPVGKRPQGLGWALVGHREGANVWRRMLNKDERRGFCRLVQPGKDDCCRYKESKRWHTVATEKLEDATTGRGSLLAPNAEDGTFRSESWEEVE